MIKLSHTSMNKKTLFSTRTCIDELISLFLMRLLFFSIKTSSVMASLHSLDRDWRGSFACPTSRWDCWRQRTFAFAPPDPSSLACRVRRGDRTRWWRFDRCPLTTLLGSLGRGTLRHHVIAVALKLHNVRLRKPSESVNTHRSTNRQVHLRSPTSLAPLSTRHCSPCRVNRSHRASSARSR